MAIVGLLGTKRLVLRPDRPGTFFCGFRARRLNIAFASISVGRYTAQARPGHRAPGRPSEHPLAACLGSNHRGTVLERPGKSPASTAGDKDGPGALVPSL